MEAVLEKPKAEEAEAFHCAAAARLGNAVHGAQKAVESTVRDAKAAVNAKLEDGKFAAGRLLKRGRYAAEDTVEEAAHRIKQHPFNAIAIAFAAGALLGFALPRFHKK
jgi:ElaB/YqjD/DUF883 family membrane-anchored ribosome-binding protein